MSASGTSSSPPLKLTKAQLAERAKEFHRNRAKNSNAANPAADGSASSSATRVDPLEQVLNNIISSTDQSYDEFVRSFDDDAEIERKDEDGKNALTVRKEKLRQQADVKTEQQEDATTTTTPDSSSILPSSSASSSSSSTAPSSDLILLIRMLQEDKERMKHDTRIVTDVEQTEEEEATALFRGNTGSSAIRMTRAEMDCIRVDDSYGFTADPFAPEAAAQMRGTNEASDVEEGEDESVITRVLGEEDEAVAAGENDEAVGSSSHAPVSYTEDEAGASLESLPVEESYTYSSENDRMTEEQWRQRRFPAAAAVVDGPRIEEIMEGDEVASAAVPISASASSVAASSSLNPNSTRGASRLAADELVAARRHRTHEPLSTSDQVEIFHYDPTRNDNEYAQEEKEQPQEEQQEVLRVVRSAVGMQRAVASSTSAIGHSSLARVPVTTSSSSSAAPRIIHRPAADATTRPPILVSPLAAASSAFSPTNSEGSDVDEELDDEIETVDLATQATTSVPLIRTVASSSSPAGTTAVASHRAPTVRIGNLLDVREQMGFEMDEDDQKVNEEDEEDEHDPHDNDISDHSDAEWLDVASLDTPAVANATVPRRRM